jgi:hypothetical protein
MTSLAQWDALALSHDHDFHPERHLPFALFVEVSYVSNVMHLYVLRFSTYFACVIEESFDYL